MGFALRRSRSFERDGAPHRQRLLDASRVGALLREAGFRFRNLAGYGEMRFRKGHRAFLATKT